MDYLVPDYFAEFNCIASACTDSCCRAGWEIPIDGETLDFYRSVDIGIDENIYVDQDGDSVFNLRPDRSCVYLRADGLCDIYIKTGGRLCDICTKYPRFFEEYDGFSEAGLAVSCPVAAELILGREGNPYGDLSRQSDDRLLEFLAAARERAIGMIYQEKSPETAAELLLGYGLDLQELIDFDALDELECVDFAAEELLSPDELSALRSFIAEKTEILTTQWLETLKSSPAECQSTARERRNYLAYLVYRYFLKAINTEDIATQCRFIAAMYQLVCSLGCEFAEAVKITCREIEHDLDNVAAILEFLQV